MEKGKKNKNKHGPPSPRREKKGGGVNVWGSKLLSTGQDLEDVVWSSAAGDLQFKLDLVGLKLLCPWLRTREAPEVGAVSDGSLVDVCQIR